MEKYLEETKVKWAHANNHHAAFLLSVSLYTRFFLMYT